MGSGKTVVAVYAMLLAVAHETQAVLMAPTEVLARQHAETLDRLLAASRARIGLLTGGLSAKQRERAAAGDRRRAMSTRRRHPGGHRRRTSSSQRLGLVVIDEQHKFGVRQRAALQQVGRRRTTW